MSPPQPGLEREAPADAEEVEALYDLVFGPGRRALSSYRLRQGVPPVASLCTVCREPGGQVVGAIRFWPIRIGDAGAPALLVGPVGVHPVRQGEGIGAALIVRGLAEARRTTVAAAGNETGFWQRAVLIGDEPYYRRFGFRRDLGRALAFPPPTDPARVLAVALAAEGMRGVSGEVRAWDGHASGGG